MVDRADTQHPMAKLKDQSSGVWGNHGPLKLSNNCRHGGALTVYGNTRNSFNVTRNGITNVVRAGAYLAEISGGV
jgi:hypothetical protein